MSLRASSGLPCACSGDMNSGVPKTMPSCVSMIDPGRISRSVTLARPKSSTFGKSRRPPWLQRKMFSGLRSRWMMPSRCASSSAPHTWIRIGSARSTGSGPFGAHHLVEVLPLQVLHHDVERAVLELAVEEHLHGVRVREVAHRPRLAAEARDQVFAVGELGVEDLHRHHPVHRRLAGLVDRPIPPDPIFCRIWNWPFRISRPMNGSGLAIDGPPFLTPHGAVRPAARRVLDANRDSR